MSKLSHSNDKALPFLSGSKSLTLVDRRFQAESKLLEAFYVGNQGQEEKQGESRVSGERDPSLLTVNVGAFPPEQQSQRAEGPPSRLPGRAFGSVYHRSHS